MGMKGRNGDASNNRSSTSELGRNASECECYLRAMQEYWKMFRIYTSPGPRQVSACPFDKNGKIT